MNHGAMESAWYSEQQEAGGASKTMLLRANRLPIGQLALALFLCTSPVHVNACSTPNDPNLFDEERNNVAFAIFRGIVKEIRPVSSEKSVNEAIFEILEKKKGKDLSDAPLLYREANGVNCGWFLERGSNVWIRVRVDAQDSKLWISDVISPPGPTIRPPRENPRLPIMGPEVTNDLYYSKAISDEGTVILLLNVDNTGSVTGSSIATSSGSTSLDKTALDLSRSWKFNPGTSDGVPTAMPMKFRIVFRKPEYYSR